MSIDLHNRVSCAHLFKTWETRKQTAVPVIPSPFTKQSACIHFLTPQFSGRKSQRVERVLYYMPWKTPRVDTNKSGSWFTGHFKEQILLSSKQSKICMASKFGLNPVLCKKIYHIHIKAQHFFTVSWAVNTNKQK